MAENTEQIGWTYKRLRRYSRLRPAVAALVDNRIHGNRINRLEEELTSCERTNQMLDVIEDCLQGDHTPAQLQRILEVMLHQEPNTMLGHKQLRDAMFILDQGDEILKRLCWAYVRDPYLFEQKYAVDVDTFRADQEKGLGYPYLSLAPLIHVQNAGLLLNKEVWYSYKTVLDGKVNEAYLKDAHKNQPFNAMAKSGMWGARLIKNGADVKKALLTLESNMFPPRSKDQHTL